ncbi:MAG: 2Fe-2S iron-sulfur cluster binding domain-containing protein [Planctomycetia bacterium]|nr:2Fe-2S iron-sulfur cluster binding domain-containing protein [Planctomycetia bacterium]
MDAVVFVLGAVLIALVCTQLGLVTLSSIREMLHGRERRRLALEALREHIETARISRARREQEALHWNGYRKFVVQRKVCEADNVCSFYLAPHDGKRLPLFKPGQYLTFRLKIPGRDKPVIRCYSLSDAPRSEYYRITIKRVGPPPQQPDSPPGLVSNYFHDHVHEGDILDVQAPNGHFVLDPADRRPVALIAGGVGITPLLCMVNSIAARETVRPMWLFYGVRNGKEHAMKEHLRELAGRHEHIRVVNFYSHPTDQDVAGSDYDHGECIRVELLRQYLKSTNYQFFVCGPPGMMQAVTTQLRDWGVPKEDILTEAFGPATVSKVFASPPPATPGAGTPAGPATKVKVTFSKSGKVCCWDAKAENLLDFALSNGVQIDCGCRAGNCGTCVVALKSGKVNYLTEHGAAVEEGACLTCVTAPQEDIVLDA